MASYYDYGDYGPADYDSPEPTYYDPEPSYDPEPEYYDPEPPYDDDVSRYDNQDDADVPTDEIYEDYGHGSDADIPAYHKGGYYVEEDGDVGAMSMDCDGPRYEADYLVQGSDEYLLEDEKSPVEDAFACTAHIEAPCAFADVLEGDGVCCPDAVAWADEWVRCPPSGECSATWESAMHAWRERIVADAAPESPTQLMDAESPAPPHAPWMADHLDAMQYALQQGHVPDDERVQNAQTLAELCADQLADECAQATGWVWDEERGDYWHPDHGYTADDPELADDEVDLEGQLESVIPPDDEPADFTGAPTPDVAATPASTDFVEYPSYPVDLPAAYDVEANFLEDAFHQTIDILSMRSIPSPSGFKQSARDLAYERIKRWGVKCAFADAPPPCARPPPTARKRPIRMRAPPSTSSGPTVCSRPRVVQRSTSARSKGKTRHAPPRRTRSCPDFKHETPPHLLLPADASTPSIPVPDAVQSKVVAPDIAGTAVASPPPKSTVRAHSRSPPDFHRTRFACALPTAVISPTSPPIPPDTSPASPHSPSSPGSQFTADKQVGTYGWLSVREYYKLSTGHNTIPGG
ncbi:hypothetical protein B0H13DRAFT_2310197 [Mycena leptocephala]|nr:hypothetical protein B0H13DRAFT_2310197 [Mycena leptocephala]